MSLFSSASFSRSLYSMSQCSLYFLTSFDNNSIAFEAMSFLSLLAISLRSASICMLVALMCSLKATIYCTSFVSIVSWNRSCIVCLSNTTLYFYEREQCLYVFDQRKVSFFCIWFVQQKAKHLRT